MRLNGAADRKEPEDSVLEKLGPGLITGAADDDQAASRPTPRVVRSSSTPCSGRCSLHTRLWSVSKLLVSGSGLAGNIRRHYPPAMLYSLVSLLLIANTITSEPISLQWQTPRHY
jgi:hypothetical protein